MKLNCSIIVENHVFLHKLLHAKKTRCSLETTKDIVCASLPQLLASSVHMLMREPRDTVN